MNNSEKVVRISVWYLVLNLFSKIGIWIGAFAFLWMFSYMIGLSDNTSQTISLFGSGILTLALLSNNLLYWKNSGISVTKKGDHVVKQGGWFVKEDTLINGVIIANQVKRNPIDQIFGMASIQTGLFSNKMLSGVRYKDLQAYNDKMRAGSGGTFSSMF